jgi:integral membrane protein (TIGR01906 family)
LAKALAVLRTLGTASGLLLLALLINIQAVAYSVNWYQAEFARLQSYQNIGTTLQEVERFSRQTTRFLMGRESDPNMEMVMGGVERSFLNEKEVAHMRDVQRLFSWARWLTLGLLLPLILWGILAHRHRSAPAYWRAMFQASVCALLLGLLAAFLIAQDFTQAFDRFHELAFSNDLWMLDPRQDQLINLLPEQFFADAAATAVLRTGGQLLLLAGATFWLSRRAADRFV